MAGNERLLLRTYRDAPGLAISDPRIVYHRVEGTEFVDLIGDATRLSNARQIPITTVSAPGTPDSVSLPRFSFRACRTTRCPCSISN
jgi:hypothetical protein